MIADAPTLALHLSASERQRIVAEEPRWLQRFAALLASLLGVSRQTLNGSLSRLQLRGLLRVGFRSIEILGQGASAPQPQAPRGAAWLRQAQRRRSLSACRPA